MIAALVCIFLLAHSAALRAADQSETAPAVESFEPVPGNEGSLWRIPLRQLLKSDEISPLSPYSLGDNVVVAQGDKLVARNWSDGRPISNGTAQGRLLRIVHSPDQNWLSCGVIDSAGKSAGTFSLIDRSLQNPVVMNGHTVGPWSFVFSPNASRLATLSHDGSDRLWSIPDGKQVAKFAGEQWEGGVGTSPTPRHGELADFSRDGKWLAIALNSNVTLRLAENGKEDMVWPVHERREIEEIHFAHDSQSLFALIVSMGTAANENTEAILQLNLQSKEVRRFKSAQSVGRAIVLPDGKHLVTWAPGSRSPDVVVWDIESRSSTAVLSVAPIKVCDVALSPNNAYLATAGDDNQIKFWNLATYQQADPASTLTIKSPRNDLRIDHLQFSLDGKYLAVAYDVAHEDWLEIWPAPEFCAAPPLATNTFSPR